jgi:hypothetical protein
MTFTASPFLACPSLIRCLDPGMSWPSWLPLQSRLLDCVAYFNMWPLKLASHWTEDTCIGLPEPLNRKYSWTKSSICTSLLSFAMTTKVWLQGFQVTCHTLQVHVLFSKFTTCLKVETVTSVVLDPSIKTS